MRAVKIVGLFLLTTVFLIGGIVLGQNILIFPAAYSLTLANKDYPPEVEPLLMRTPDQQTLELWRRPGSDTRHPYVALLLHGNGQDITNFTEIPAWIRSLGLASYSLDYRGFGRSTGSPSEAGIYLDVESAMQTILMRENISPSKLIVVGHSLGAAPALYLSARYDLAAVVLFAPFSSLTAVVAEHPLYRYLKQFLWYEFPNAQYIAQTRAKCILIAHGKEDRIIPYEHSEFLGRETNRAALLFTVIQPDADHISVIAKTKGELTPYLLRCLTN